MWTLGSYALLYLKFTYEDIMMCDLHTLPLADIMLKCLALENINYIIQNRQGLSTKKMITSDDHKHFQNEHFPYVSIFRSSPF